jgi:hypothetical protein
MTGRGTTGGDPQQPCTRFVPHPLRVRPPPVMALMSRERCAKLVAVSKMSGTLLKRLPSKYLQIGGGGGRERGDLCWAGRAQAQQRREHAHTLCPCSWES